MRKLFSILIIITLLFTFGCTKDNDNKDLLTTIKEKGEIVVAMEGTWAPWTYHDENDKLVGFDVEVAEAIASKLGVKVSFVEGDFDGLLAGVDSKRYDTVINGIDITEARKEKYDFTDAYAYGQVALIVRTDNTTITSFNDLKGKKTANTLSSSYASISEEYGAETVGVDTLDQTFDLLLAGRIDATINAEVSFYDYMKAHPDAPLKVACLYDNPTEVSIPLRKGSETESLRLAINAAIAELKGDGTLSNISTKYFGIDITK